MTKVNSSSISLSESEDSIPCGEYFEFTDTALRNSNYLGYTHQYFALM